MFTFRVAQHKLCGALIIYHTNQLNLSVTQAEAIGRILTWALHSEVHF